MSPQRCSWCGGDLVVLGRLGTLWWFRCRDCGAEIRHRDEEGMPHGA